MFTQQSSELNLCGCNDGTDRDNEHWKSVLMTVITAQIQTAVCAVCVCHSWIPQIYGYIS